LDDYNLEFLDEEKFDFIHQREITGSITDPPVFYKRCFDALLPGGWIDGSFDDCYSVITSSIFCAPERQTLKSVIVVSGRR